jgi:hypothetical protein
MATLLRVSKYLYQITIYCQSTIRLPVGVLSNFDDFESFQKEILSEEWISSATKVWSRTQWPNIIHMLTRYRKSPFSEEEITNWTVRCYFLITFEIFERYIFKIHA